MFYQYNSFSGKLTGSQQFQPCFPLSPQPAPQGEAPKVTFADPNTTIAKESPPPFRGAGGKMMGAVSEALRQQQKLFQAPNNIPIHLKGGQMDKILFGATIALCGLSLMGCFKVYYDLSVPRK
ncbi:uncharacterized protein LOC124157758 [Ischnura elegans]|uniref:uncharacterized protein LOC124157758 n=1 Tax=Ischnura elegans TaxID=197161 RepID=UPI001ED8923F|nr:uncharacterized protein LOC124157758 [Ischnura elegans]